jgi:hypothetical protein
MTSEEAILCLKGIKNIGHDIFTEQKDFQECLDMAIKALEQEPCEDSISRQLVIKEILRLWNSGGDKDYCMETLRDYAQELPPVTSIYEKLKCVPKEMTHEERVLIELTRDMPKKMGVLYIQSFQQDHGPFTDEAAEIIREYLSKE